MKALYLSCESQDNAVTINWLFSPATSKATFSGGRAHIGACCVGGTGAGGTKATGTGAGFLGGLHPTRPTARRRATGTRMQNSRRGFVVARRRTNVTLRLRQWIR